MKLVDKLCVAIFTVAAVVSCDTSALEERIDSLESRIHSLEKSVGQVNDNAVALRQLMKDNVWIEEYETVLDGEKTVGYVLTLSDGTTVKVVYGIVADAVVPMIGIDSEGKWIMSMEGGKTFSRIEGATGAAAENGVTPQVRVDSAGFWQISLDGGKTWKHILGADGNPQSAESAPAESGGSASIFRSVTYDAASQRMTFVLAADGQTIVLNVIQDFRFTVEGYTPKTAIFFGNSASFNVTASDVAEVMLEVPDGWRATFDGTKLTVAAPEAGTPGDYSVSVVAVSNGGLMKRLTLEFKLTDMIAGLLDYSYAGYNHGETAPAEASAWGYKVYNVCDYGAVPNDGKSDRDAFLKCLEAALGVSYTVNDNNVICFGNKAAANAIVYFPEGEFILHTSDDDVELSGKSPSRTIQIRSGNIILRGAGRDKTVLVMQDPNKPSDESVLYSSPAMIEFKHNSGLAQVTTVTSNAAKGSFSVDVASAAGLSEGQWVCLSVVNNDPAFVAAELKAGNPTDAELATMTNIKTSGVQVYDYHQIRSISGNKLTFVEPLMHEVDLQYTANTNPSGYNWGIYKFPHYENVGVEDLTFRGNAKDHFEHHGSWQDDGAYKPLNFVRLTNSWLRRVGFESVSEACSIVTSANVSAYDITFSGRRGHAAVRSQGSSRVFIGATTDRTSGYLIDSPETYSEQAGQYHAVGVSKQSMGAVLWRNTWGNDSCFESHATQPRATLIDCCTGGWMQFRQGGDAAQVPNHLADLVVWNFESTTPQATAFIFWDHGSRWWKFIPPVIVGFHGEPTTFESSQVQAELSNGTPFFIESLYEHQLKARLGAVPAWLQSLK